MKKLFIFILICALSATTAKCADLKYLVDMRTALMDMCGIRTATDYLTSTALNRAVNRGIKFVESGTKTNQEITGFVMRAEKFRYALEDSISQNGVEAVWLLNTENLGDNEALEPLGLSYKPMSEFSKGKFTSTEVFTTWDNVIFISKPPSEDYDSLYAFTYKVTSDLTGDSSIVPLPIGWKRELAVLYAYKIILEGQQNDAKATRIWNEWKEQWQLQTGTVFKEAEPLNQTNP